MHDAGILTRPEVVCTGLGAYHTVLSLWTFVLFVMPLASAVVAHCGLGDSSLGELCASVPAEWTRHVAAVGVCFLRHVVVTGHGGFYAGPHDARWAACFSVLVHLPGSARPFDAVALHRLCTGVDGLAGNLQPPLFPSCSVVLAPLARGVVLPPRLRCPPSVVVLS